MRRCARDGGASRCLHPSASVSIRQHTSAYVSIRQHTSAYVSIRQASRCLHPQRLRSQNMYFCTSKASKLSTSPVFENVCQGRPPPRQHNLLRLLPLVLRLQLLQHTSADVSMPAAYLLPLVLRLQLLQLERQRFRFRLVVLQRFRFSLVVWQGFRLTLVVWQRFRCSCSFCSSIAIVASSSFSVVKV
jgi:hypothetical protein